MRPIDPFSTDTTDTALLLAELESGLRRPHGQDPTIAAIIRLGELGSVEAIPLLREAVGHANIGVKTQAAFALQRLGQKDGLRALDLFLKEETAAAIAAQLLIRIGSEEAVEVLLRAKSEPGERMFNGQMTPISVIVDTLLNKWDPARFAAPRGPSRSESGCMLVAAGLAGVILVLL